MADLTDAPLSPNDFHLLLALAERDLYGYALLKAMQRDSGGAISPDIGSLYRALARMVGAGLVEEADEPRGEGSSPGKPRRYYRITPDGRRALAADAARQRASLEIAAARLS